FLESIAGATSKELLVRDDDVQVLHGFSTVADAQAYLGSEVFTRDVANELSPLLQAEPVIRIYDVAYHRSQQCRQIGSWNLGRRSTPEPWRASIRTNGRESRLFRRCRPRAPRRPTRPLRLQRHA